MSPQIFHLTTITYTDQKESPFKARAVSSPVHARPSYDPRALLAPRNQIRASMLSSKSPSKSAAAAPQRHLTDISMTTPNTSTAPNGDMYGSTSMLEGLYGAEKRQNVSPHKRKRDEAIVIDDDDDDKQDKQKSKNGVRHKGTGIIGEYMKEGKNLAPPSNSFPVDLTKGMLWNLILSQFVSMYKVANTLLQMATMTMWYFSAKGIIPIKKYVMAFLTQKCKHINSPNHSKPPDWEDYKALGPQCLVN